MADAVVCRRTPSSPVSPASYVVLDGKAARDKPLGQLWVGCQLEIHAKESFETLAIGRGRLLDAF